MVMGLAADGLEQTKRPPDHQMDRGPLRLVRRLQQHQWPFAGSPGFGLTVGRTVG